MSRAERPNHCSLFLPKAAHDSGCIVPLERARHKVGSAPSFYADTDVCSTYNILRRAHELPIGFEGDVCKVPASWIKMGAHSASIWSTVRAGSRHTQSANMLFALLAAGG